MIIELILAIAGVALILYVVVASMAMLTIIKYEDERTP